MPKNDEDSESLKRIEGGRWQTKDGRFTIEQQSGRWVVVDAEQTDELGLPRVRGPYGSLRDAREALGDIREAPAQESPLKEQIARRGNAAAKTGGERTKRETRAEKEAPEPEPPPEPAWLATLPDKRRDEARRLIRDLEAADLPDPIGLARRDVAEDEPAAARALLLRRLATVVLVERAKRGGLEPDRLIGELLTWLSARTRDPDAPMRLPGWRLVEDSDAGRRIEISRRDLEREIDRLERRESRD
jgi:hypothetical protein